MNSSFLYNFSEYETADAVDIRTSAASIYLYLL